MFAVKRLSFIFLVFLLSCKGNRGKHEHSFYFWKTVFDFDSTATNELKKLGADHMYLHYFDIDWSEPLQMPVPRGETPQYSFTLPLAVSKYTPVVYITNTTFEQISAGWCDTLAVKLTEKIATKTKKITRDYVTQYTANAYNIDQYYAEERTLPDDSVKMILEIDREIQIDCDWTATTKDKYFRFLRKFRELNPGKTISATIRLYPYKYKDKMGVPPVDRGMLMCYNLGGIKDANTKNSVFDLAQMKLYLDGGEYPLPLDIALPSFGWQVWFREGSYKGIVHNWLDLDAGTQAFRKQGNVYRVIADTVIGDNYYREGDELRPEQPDEQELLKAADILAGKIPGFGRITFFDWSDLSTTKYEKVIQRVFDRY